MSVKRAHLFWIIPLLLLLAFVAYVFYKLNDFVKPELVDIDTDFAIADHKDKAKVLSTLYLFNDNDFDIKVDSVWYKMFIDGELYAEGKVPEKIVLSANDTTAVNLPYSFDIEKFKAEFENTGKDSGLHRLEFDFFTNIFKRRIRIEYDWEKNTPVFKVPKMEVQEIKLIKLGLKATELEATLKLKNVNDIKLLSDKLDYSFKVENNVLAEGEITRDKYLPSEGSTILTVPITLDLREVINEFGLLSKKYEGKDYTLTLKAELKNTKGGNPPYYNFDIFKSGKLEDLVEQFKEERKRKKEEKREDKKKERQKVRG